MGKLVKFTEVCLRAKITGPGEVEYTSRVVGPVWVNPMGVNLVKTFPGASATQIVLDDGTSHYTVEELLDVVVAALNEQLQTDVW